MANKSYVMFDGEDQSDRGYIVALDLIARLFGVNRKDAVCKMIDSFKDSEDYKAEKVKLLKEIEEA